ncbi:MAG: hypothetical protein GY786_04595, partial [Proteobacteria bacterium]|nr:hypothetical protein [Pseudomonadota bacterium]
MNEEIGFVAIKPENIAAINDEDYDVETVRRMMADMKWHQQLRAAPFNLKSGALTKALIALSVDRNDEEDKEMKGEEEKVTTLARIPKAFTKEQYEKVKTIIFAVVHFELLYCEIAKFPNEIKRST